MMTDKRPLAMMRAILVALDRLADRLSSGLMVEYLAPVGSRAGGMKVGARVVSGRVRGLGVAPKQRAGRAGKAGGAGKKEGRTA